MLIEAGFDIAFECPAPTPMLLQLNIHPSRDADLLTPDRIVSDPPLPMRNYLDHFGNRVTRVEVPAGNVVFSNRFVIEDLGQPDETPPEAETTPIADLPDDALALPAFEPLLRQRQARRFRLVAIWKRRRRNALRAGDLRISCMRKSGSTTWRRARPAAASDSMHEGVGVCRDFAHLAIALCRCMNIPARYCTGYLGDIGVPPTSIPMDFSAWAEVFLDGRWWTMDARHNHPRIGRVVMGRGRDAADVAMSTAFGVANLRRFVVVTDERVERR